METITRTIGSSAATACLAVFVTYIAPCRSLRYVRRTKKHAQFPYKTREDLKKMTAEDAWEIVRYVQGLETSWSAGQALGFALFKSVTMFNVSGLCLKLYKNIRYPVHLKVVVRNTAARKG